MATSKKTDSKTRPTDPEPLLEVVVVGCVIAGKRHGERVALPESEARGHLRRMRAMTPKAFDAMTKASEVSSPTSDDGGGA